jgi:beta-lactamase class A
MKDTSKGFLRQLRLHWKRILLYGIGSVSFLIIVIQLLYPSGQMLPHARIDNLDVGGWQKADVVWELDRRYLTTRIPIYFGMNSTPYRSPVTSEVGMVIQNRERIDQMSYAWWLRLLPTSLIWAYIFHQTPDPVYEIDQPVLDAYIQKELGQSCDVAPKNAGVVFEKGSLQVVKSEMGGTCETATIEAIIMKTRPTLEHDVSVRVPIQEIPPMISTAAAQDFITSLTHRIGEGVPVQIGDGSVVVIPADQLISWLDFTTENEKLSFQVNGERSLDFLVKNIAPKVAVTAGITRVTTIDFVETARQDGVNGQVLDIDKTLASVQAFLSGEREVVGAVTDLTMPKIEYTRSYSPTDIGLSALLQNFAKDRTGVFGVSFIELSGKHRRGTYNENKIFVTASTYKLFVAFSTLKRVDTGTWSWEDANISSGRNLAACFDDMIVKSDNACAEALLKKIGYKTITDEVKSVGLVNTSFTTGDTPHSTASDESLFLAQLEMSQLPLSPASRDRLLSAMKRNIYRQGIPKGTNGVVADKVGFLWGLLHDSAVVYSPSGTYVLVIMTDGSSWQAIADLTRQIESLLSS